MTMRDCPDGAMRDQLPLFVSGKLDHADHERVEAHLQTCADCAAEVALLRAAVRAYDVAPLDAATIAEHLPTARAAKRARPIHRQPLWRVAAAVTMMIAGTATVMVVQKPDFSPVAGTGVDRATPITVPSTGPKPESTIAMLPTPVAAAGISFGNNLSDLTDAQLEALLASLERMDGAVSADPVTLVTPIIPDGEGRRNQ